MLDVGTKGWFCTASASVGCVWDSVVTLLVLLGFTRVSSKNISIVSSYRKEANSCMFQQLCSGFEDADVIR